MLVLLHMFLTRLAQGRYLEGLVHDHLAHHYGAFRALGCLYLPFVYQSSIYS